MLTVLALTVCLIAAPEQCITIFPSTDAELTMQSCPMLASVIAARWLEENPKWQVRRMACTTGRKVANRAS